MTDRLTAAASDAGSIPASFSAAEGRVNQLKDVQLVGLWPGSPGLPDLASDAYAQGENQGSLAILAVVLADSFGVAVHEAYLPRTRVQQITRSLA